MEYRLSSAPLPGCAGQGNIKEEALENIKEAIGLCLEVRAEMGLPLTLVSPS